MKYNKGFDIIMESQTLQRKTLPQSLKSVFQVSQFVTLYLIAQYSPTQFHFIDPLGNEHRVSIGQKLSCSCLPGNYDHCLHTFYVMFKIYKLSQDDPWIFQKSYSKQQMKSILSGQRRELYNQSKNKKKKVRKEITNEKIIPNVQKNQQKKTQTVKEPPQQQQPNKLQKIEHINQTIKEKNKKSNIKISQDIPIKQTKKEQDPQIVQYDTHWPQFEEDTLCSICHEYINNQTAIINCKKVCKNYFHTKCLKVWAKYKKGDSSTIICPMCRGQFQDDLDKRIQMQQKRFIKIFYSHDINCSQCGKDILVKLFRCLLCQNTNLCQSCYMGWKHQNHDKFMMKKNNKAQWAISTGRNKFDMSKLDITMQYLKQTNQQSQDLQNLFGANYQKFTEQHAKKTSSIQFFTNCFLDVGKQIFKTYKKIDFEEKDLVCCICRKKHVTQMRRLLCKHFVDEKCLKFWLVNGFRQCPVDKTPLLPGLKQINFTIKKQK